MDKDVFLAVLAMDVYNRGENFDLEMPGNQIGNATIHLVRSDPSGFFAQSYTLELKQKIRSPFHNAADIDRVSENLAR